MPKDAISSLRKWSLSFTLISFICVHTGTIVWWASGQTAITKALTTEIVEIRAKVNKKVSLEQFERMEQHLDESIEEIANSIKEGTKDRIYKGEALQIIENLNNKVEDNRSRITDLKQDHKENVMEIKSDIREIKLDIRELLTTGKKR